MTTITNNNPGSREGTAGEYKLGYSQAMKDVELWMAKLEKRSRERVIVREEIAQLVEEVLYQVKIKQDPGDPGLDW